MANLLRRFPVVVQAAGFYADTVVTAAAGFTFWILAARTYPVEEVGRTVAVLGALHFIAGLANLGFGNFFVRHGREAWAPGEVGTALSLSFVLGLLATLAYVLAVPRVLAVPVWVLFVLAGAWAWGPVLTGMLFGKGGAGRLIGRDVLSNGLRIGLIAAVAGRGSLLLLYAATPLANVALSGLLLRGRRVLASSGRRLGALFEYSGWTFVAGWLQSGTAFLLPPILLALVGAEASATFFVAQTISGLLFTIGHAISQAMVRELGTGRVQLRRYQALAVGLTVAAWIVLAIVGRPVLALFGPTYLKAYPYALVLGVAGVFRAAGFPIAGAFQLRYRYGPLLLMTGVNAAVLLTSLFPLVARVGALGAALATLLGTVVGTAVGIVAAARDPTLLPVSDDLPTPGKPGD